MIRLRSASPGVAAASLCDMTREGAATLGQVLAAISPWMDYETSDDAMTKYLSANEPGAPRYELHVGDAIAGAVGLRLNWLRGPYLQHLSVLPPFQRQGFGGVILTWFQNEARARGDRNLWVAAADFNSDAIQFYERFGFVRVADLPNVIRDGKTEILFRKSIALLSA